LFNEALGFVFVGIKIKVDILLFYPFVLKSSKFCFVIILEFSGSIWESKWFS